MGNERDVPQKAADVHIRVRIDEVQIKCAVLAAELAERTSQEIVHNAVLDSQFPIGQIGQANPQRYSGQQIAENQQAQFNQAQLHHTSQIAQFRAFECFP